MSGDLDEFVGQSSTVALAAHAIQAVAQRPGDRLGLVLCNELRQGFWEPVGFRISNVQGHYFPHRHTSV
jgi:hypothetical protein